MSTAMDHLDMPVVIEQCADDTVHGIRLDGLTKRFKRIGGEQVNAIDDLSLQIRQGEFLVLVGPSGCGKTTLLRCLAGLETPDEGTIIFGGKTVFSSTERTNLTPEKRDAAMLFQSYALWPHMTVFDNVAYPLRSQRVPKGQIRERVHAILGKVQCEELEGQYPGQISGGQQQRVALARALVAGNQTVFFDEPLSNIDAKVRDQLRWEIQKIQRELGFTAIYVTHDQTEALTLADRIAILRKGTVAQLGTPLDVYDKPDSAYVARFMGTLNELPGSIREHRNGESTYETSMGMVRIDVEPAGDTDAITPILGFRPTACRLFADDEDVAKTENVFRVQVIAEVFLGTHFEYVVETNGTECRCWSFTRLQGLNGNQAWLHIPASGIRLLTQ